MYSSYKIQKYLRDTERDKYLRACFLVNHVNKARKTFEKSTTNTKFWAAYSGTPSLIKVNNGTRMAVHSKHLTNPYQTKLFILNPF